MTTTMRRAFAVLAAIALALTCIAITATPALAKTYAEDWTVEFTGDKMIDNNSANITKTIAGLQPGDSAQFSITLKESASTAADWYMRNEVLATMEETFEKVNASGGSYSYRLTFITPAGEKKVILTNDVVSGDANTGSTEGLKDATSGTTEWFFLDTLAAGAQASMQLDVALDGETHGNTYFDSEAVIKLSFAAEPTDEPGTSGSGDPQDPKDEKKSDKDDSKKDADKKPSLLERLAQTGDMLPIGIIAIVVIAAGAVLVVAAVRRRKNEIEEGEAR